MAPLIAALINMGLPLIAQAVKTKGKELVEDKLGMQLAPDMSVEQIQVARDAEITNKQWLIEAGQKEFETEIADRGNARAMQMAALAQDDLLSKRFIYYFAAGCMSFSGIYILLITFVSIPEKNLRFADTVLGFVLGTMVATILYYFFGTSKNSQRKDETINNLTKDA